MIGPVEGGVLFDWEPSIGTGAELLGARGHDARLEQVDRATRKERRDAYLGSMDAKEAARQELRDERDSGLWTDPSSAGE